MILTGKCKEDFLNTNIGIKAIYENGTLEDFNQLFINALIIDFFDSLKVAGFKSLWSYCFGNYDVFKDNWNEHIEQSIKKANEIYNTKINNAKDHRHKNKKCL